MERTAGPTTLVLTRQKLPVLDQQRYGSAAGTLRGAYVLSRELGSQPDLILLGSGSEVHILLEAQADLAKQDIDTRVVSMPSWELFAEQSPDYREQVLPSAVTARLALEAGASMGWREWVGPQGAIIAIDRFGASAPYQTIYREYGLSVENVVEQAHKLLGN